MKLPRPRWWVILTVLTLQLLLNPCWHSEIKQVGDIFLMLLNCATIVILLHYLSSQKTLHRLFGLFLGLPILILYWIPNSPETIFAIYLLTLLFYLYIISLAIPTLLSIEKVGKEEVAASLSLYLLIGMTWAIGYFFIELFHPHSFSLDQGAEVMAQGNISNFVYLSFVTLTTLGYGDIVPVSCVARSLAILEAVCGLACLSFIVARLVGLSSAQIKKEG